MFNSMFRGQFARLAPETKSGKLVKFVTQRAPEKLAFKLNPTNDHRLVKAVGE